MKAKTTNRRLYIVGVGLRGDGYPNAKNTIKALIDGGWEIHNLAHWLPEDLHLWRIMRDSWWHRFRLFFVIIWAGLRQALLCIKLRSDTIVFYVPYPAPFLLWWLSWVPKQFRPRCIADGYISIWDSMFIDRSKKSPDRLTSRLVKWNESRALKAADVVIVDTVKNRHWMSSCLGIVPEKTIALPLAIDEPPLKQTSIQKKSDKYAVRVLYVGTFVPLHGIETLIETMDALADNNRIYWKIIGDGQHAPLLEKAISRQDRKNILWDRDWHNREQLAKEINDADICLGVFGGNEKAARVLPFKVYLYLAFGKPVISQKTFSLPEGAPQPPIYTTKPDAYSIADSIQTLSKNTELRNQLAYQSRVYYESFLANSLLAKRFEDLICK